MLKRFRAWIKEFKDDMTLADFHAGVAEEKPEPIIVETFFDIHWYNEDAHEVTKQIRVPRSEVANAVVRMLEEETIEVGDMILFRWNRGT